MFYITLPPSLSPPLSRRRIRLVWLSVPRLPFTWRARDCRRPRHLCPSSATTPAFEFRHIWTQIDVKVNLEIYFIDILR